MNKKIIVTALVGMLLLTSCSISIDIDADRKSGDNTDIISNHELTMKELEDILNGTEKKDNEIKFIDGIYGVYGEDDGAMYQDTIEVFKGKDENHIDISAYFYRRASFYMKDMEIIRNKNGEVIATKFVGPEESVWDYFVKDQYLGDATLDVIIKDNTVKLRFNKDLNMIDKETEKEKINLKAITEEDKQKALNNVLESDFKDINEDIFEIIHDTKNYLVLRVKCYILEEGKYGKDYNIEGSESVGMYKYYNIDKKNKKILKLDDIIYRLDDVNEYISKAIDEKRDNWFSEQTYGQEWGYEEFKGIGEIEYIENYFEIDENKKIVKIRCLRYPNEANRAMGDLCIDVPFRFFNLNQ